MADAFFESVAKSQPQAIETIEIQVSNVLSNGALVMKSKQIVRWLRHP